MNMRHNTLLAYFAPIDYDRQMKSYIYTDPNYSLAESPINSVDKKDLDRALDVLSQFGGIKEILGIQPILAKLQRIIKQEDSKKSRSIIFFEQTGEYQGDDFLYQIYDAMLDQKCIQVLYQKFGKPKKSHLLSPYLLKQYKKRWYLIAYAHTEKEVRTYSLDRVISVKESFAAFIHDPEFDPNGYFKYMIGITLESGAKPERIVLKATKNQAEYLKTRPIHFSQIVCQENNEGCIFSLEVIINYDLISELFSYQDQIVILEPESLRNKMKNIMENTRSLYE